MRIKTLGSGALAILLIAGISALAQSYSYAPPAMALVSDTGSSPFVPLTTTGTTGQAYDYGSPTLLLGYNATTKKYYVCGAANPCAGAGGGGSYAGATLFAYGDSHCSGQGVTAAQVYTQILASGMNWNLQNNCGAGHSLQDEAADFNWSTRNIGPHSVTLQNMGTNDVQAYSAAEGGGVTSLNATNTAQFIASYRAWMVLNGTPTVNMQWANLALRTGTWVTTIVAGISNAPPNGMVAQTASATMSFTTLPGDRVDLHTMLYNGNSSTWSYTIDGTPGTCITATTTCAVTNTLSPTGYGGSLLLVDFATTGLPNIAHLVVVTNGASTNGVDVLGVTSSDSTVTPTSRPLVISTYVARFGTANGGYANHNDALVAYMKGLQVAELAALKTAGFNVIGYDLTNAGLPVDATTWWNPNDAAQTQSDWQHPNVFGHRNVGKGLLAAIKY